MTTLLEQAFNIASRLPIPEQDKLGSRWIAEVNSEQRWEKLFSKSQDVLSKLAAEALDDLENKL